MTQSPRELTQGDDPCVAEAGAAEDPTEGRAVAPRAARTVTPSRPALKAPPFQAHGSLSADHVKRGVDRNLTRRRLLKVVRAKVLERSAVEGAGGTMEASGTGFWWEKAAGAGAGGEGVHNIHLLSSLCKAEKHLLLLLLTPTFPCCRFPHASASACFSTARVWCHLQSSCALAPRHSPLAPDRGDRGYAQSTRVCGTRASKCSPSTRR